MTPKAPAAHSAYDRFNMDPFLSPHKLYPLYLLARMYDEKGDNEKARIIARSVMNKKVKVESKAVQEILEEMRGILDKK